MACFVFEKTYLKIYAILKSANGGKNDYEALFLFFRSSSMVSFGLNTDVTWMCLALPLHLNFSPVFLCENFPFHRRIGVSMCSSQGNIEFHPALLAEFGGSIIVIFISKYKTF